jgi:transposase
MEKIYSVLPMALYCLFILKLIFNGVTVAECGVATGLTAFMAVKEFIAHKKNLRLQEVVNTVAKQNEVIMKMATEVDALKTSMVGVKMGQGFKKVI